MPASLADFTKATKTVTVTFTNPDVSLQVDYRRWGTSNRENKAGTMLFSELIARSVVSWDLTDADGTPVPLDKDALDGVSNDILRAINEAIEADKVPNP